MTAIRRRAVSEMSIYAVNGKTPIAAWIPSRDDVGNGTTTLTDLVGSNNGTLTNMDAATDWITVGGKRAIDIDATDDKVVLAPISFTTSFSLSVWALSRSSGGTTPNPAIFSTRGLGAVGSGIAGVLIGKSTTTASEMSVLVERASGAYQSRLYASQWTQDQLAHWVMVFDRPSGSLSLYKNGTLLTPSSTVSSGSLANQDIGSATEATIGNRPNTTLRPLDGYFDDVRIFDQILDSSDVAYLYDSGNGRGRLAFVPSRRRRSRSGGGVI
jgi:hypothetical protein